MRGERTTALRASWLATALGALMALTAPVVASVAGSSAAATPGISTTAAPGDPVAAVRAARTHHPAPSVAGADTEAADPEGAPRTSSTTNATATGVGRAVAADAAPGAVAADAAPTGPQVLVHLEGAVVAHRNPWASAPTVGTVVATSRYYHVPLVAWVRQVSTNGEWGLVELPYVWPRTTGWIRLAGLRRETTSVAVTVDLSEHRLRVWKHGALRYSVRAATGETWTPTPAGHYFVTDRVPFSAGSSYGTFAFGISGIQPHLPAGWSGGDQLAIHGTNQPSSIGTNASAGCVRVSEWTLSRLLPLLRLGTPVVIQP
jgi:lipoprotein-anchoring transpeptidase ErfK/SrfK